MLKINRKKSILFILWKEYSFIFYFLRVGGVGCMGEGRRDGDGAAGWRQDRDGVGRMERRIELPGLPQPGFGLPARV